jgi:hypothetical protein
MVAQMNDNEDDFFVTTLICRSGVIKLAYPPPQYINNKIQYLEEFFCGVVGCCCCVVVDD